LPQAVRAGPPRRLAAPAQGPALAPAPRI